MDALTSASGQPRNALDFFNIDVQCDWIKQKAQSWLTPIAQPKVKAFGELGDVGSFSKHGNRSHSGAKDFATADMQNNYFFFEDAVAIKAPYSAYQDYHYSLPPALAQDF